MLEIRSGRSLVFELNEILTMECPIINEGQLLHLDWCDWRLHLGSGQKYSEHVDGRSLFEKVTMCHSNDIRLILVLSSFRFQSCHFDSSLILLLSYTNSRPPRPL